jgi:hypothetical protein
LSTSPSTLDRENKPTKENIAFPAPAERKLSNLVVSSRRSTTETDPTKDSAHDENSNKLWSELRDAQRRGRSMI